MRKEHERQRWDAFFSSERSDIWNKEPSYVSSSVWDRQTDRGQILPARQIYRPRRVGSLWDDSFIHTGKQEHTHTKCTLFKLKTSLKNISPVRPSLATVQICEETFRCKTSKEINILSFLAVLGSVCGTGERVPAGIACLARLSLVADRVCVGSLCFHLPSGQPARPNKTLYSLFQEPFLCEDSTLLGSLEGALSIFQQPFSHSKLCWPDK